MPEEKGKQIFRPEVLCISDGIMFNNTSTRCLGLHDGALLGDVDAVKKFSDILVLDLHTLLDEGSCTTQKTPISL